jgi:hypothetical protein
MGYQIRYSVFLFALRAPIRAVNLNFHQNVFAGKLRKEAYKVVSFDGDMGQPIRLSYCLLYKIIQKKSKKHMKRTHLKISLKSGKLIIINGLMKINMRIKFSQSEQLNF